MKAAVGVVTKASEWRMAVILISMKVIQMGEKANHRSDQIHCPNCDWHSRLFENVSGEIAAKVDAEMHFVDEHDSAIPDEAPFGDEQCPECLDIDGLNGTVSCKNCGFVPAEVRA